MGQHGLVGGLTQNQIGRESGAAYEDAGLHPRVSQTGRYAAPAAGYVYRGPKSVESLRFQKPMTMKARWAETDNPDSSSRAST